MTVFILNVILLVRSELLPSKGTTLPRTWNQILVLFLFSFKCIFLSTLSVRRATLPFYKVIGGTPEFLSTLSVRRATALVTKYGEGSAISIHALREESDRYPQTPTTTMLYFYPRSP